MFEELDCIGITFDPCLPEPLYLQLADALHERIKCHPGEKCVLPSLRHVAGALQIDRSTAAKAYAELERRKVIARISAYKFEVLPEAKKLRSPFPNIAVVIPRRLSDYISASPDKHCILQYITGIIDRAAEQNISTLMLQLPPPEAPGELVEDFLNEISVKVDGAIHLGARQFAHDPPLRKLFLDNRIPQVMISATPQNLSNIGCVRTDISPAVQELAEILRKTAVKHIGVAFWNKETTLSAGENPYVTYEASERCSRFIEILTAEGFAVEREYIITDCSNYYNIYHNLAALVRRKKLPELICCQNDQVAVWIIQALERQGVRVPEDVAVIGCDNCSPAPWDEKLSSVAMPFYELGGAAVDLLEEIRLKGARQLNLLRQLPAKLELKQTFSLKN